MSVESQMSVQAERAVRLADEDVKVARAGGPPHRGCDDL